MTLYRGWITKDSYGFTTESEGMVRLDMTIDNIEGDLEEVLAWFTAYWGKPIASAPGYNWSEYDGLTAERRAFLTSCIDGEEEEEAEEEIETPEVHEAICPRCGQTYDASLRMTSSAGFCCPDCYDEMSE